ncbi:hypothetical protein GE09DRAFT_1267342 [Coniochaeta sp. 2T2.1]|nr:hypothetical protein GE09DRAFT_1267342 [Coniochaeta sp. 2T2.1]
MAPRQQPWTDFHLRHPQNRSLGWRYVLNETEDWVKNEQDWPINIKKRQEETHGKEEDQAGRRATSKEANESGGSEEQGSPSKTSAEKLEAKYSAEEIAFLRALQQEKEHFSTLRVNDGKQISPQKQNGNELSIDEQDQFTPDNWLPRSTDLIRLTGKHPLNAEAPLPELFSAGLITPNKLHYVRNHGAVPRLLWEFHKLDIQYGDKTAVLTMDELKNNYDTINIPIALACDGNRRKELNMVKKSKGFNWGAGAVSCAYWRGPLLRDVLLSVIGPVALPERGWINFEGSDEPSEGNYATSIPFEYAMDPANDVMLAYQMNDVPLPPDHGYPVRLMIPGYVGGRCVKWLRRIWISDGENDSHYHVWDNRVLPSFVTDMDGDFAETLFHHPDTACNEQILNSVITKPAQGEKIALSTAHKGTTYRIEGYAYDGGGRQVQRVEVSLDGGGTWLYCIRRYPDAPIRHGNKFWTWLHWHVEVEMSQVLRAESITVRCFDVSKHTQPERPIWNIMGIMNNCWYTVRRDLVEDDSGSMVTLFRHPVEPGKGEDGWMKPSVGNEIEKIKREARTPHKQFTREEIEKHDSENDCWIVVDGKVYDATSVLSWHPGGKSAIMNHAGQVHQETTDDFSSIHDDYGYDKLNECILGVVTDKAMKLIQEDAKERGQDKDDGKIPSYLQKHRWLPVKLVDRHDASADTRTYTFGLPQGHDVLGLGTCQHVQIGFHMKDKMIIRSYTPTRPLLPATSTDTATGSRSILDGSCTFDLTVKTYFPDDNQPGGALSNIFDCIPIGEEVEIRGPTGDILYNGFGDFVIEGKQRRFERISLVLGGSGITPGYALIARIVLTKGDKTQVRVIDANKSEQDILLRDELARLERDSKGQLQLTHVLSHPSGEWTGHKGHLDAHLMKEVLFAPARDTVAFLCGPPAMVQKAALPALKGSYLTTRHAVFANRCQTGGMSRTTMSLVFDVPM